MYACTHRANMFTKTLVQSAPMRSAKALEVTGVPEGETAKGSKLSSFCTVQVGTKMVDGIGQ